jgi:peptidoglycan/xylan/chitin deacetylase (PgdA/CDA1 family)
MKNKIFSLRWDIDHLHCLEKGVPNILSVCREYSIKCTFFINLGKSLNFKEWFFKSFSKSVNKLTDVESINIIKKIGFYNLLKILILNQNVGLKRLDILHRIIDEGHELGLHGGMNHMLWSRDIKNFTEDEINSILDESIEHMDKNVGQKIFGFAAPGFAWSIGTIRSLERKGFAYTGDIEGKEPFYPRINNNLFNIMCIPVTVIGPNTIPFIEYYAAKGKTDNEISGLVFESISKKKFAVLYGHPSFEGLKTKILGNIFEYIKNNNYKVLTHKEIFYYFKNHSLANIKDIYT